MQNTFLSVITVVQTPAEIDLLPTLLSGVNEVLQQNFSDYEFILVNNTRNYSAEYAATVFDKKLGSLPAELRHHIFMLNLASGVDRNNAILAGLDRANGDYAIIFEMEFAEQSEIIVQLFDKSREGFDIVYLQANQRETSISNRFFTRLFYYILKKYSNLKIDEKAHDTRIISRRALNNLLRLRENMQYMKALYAVVGFQTTHIPTDQPLRHDSHTSFNEKFKTSLVAISSFTTFLRSLMLWIFLVSIVFMGLVIFNALKVKLTNYDIFGDYHLAVSGWTFIVVLMSIFFAITCLNLYIMSIYLGNIYQEIKHRPLYIIESVRRF